MKSRIITLSLTMGLTVAVLNAEPFFGWKTMMEYSPDIVFVRCTETPNPYAPDKNGMFAEPINGVIKSGIDVKLVLKGNTKTGASLLMSQFKPVQLGEYVVFGDFHSGYYQAIEPYRVIYLGMNFPTNTLSDQPLESQIRTAMKWRLDDLGAELPKLQNEKQRLEDGLKQ